MEGSRSPRVRKAVAVRWERIAEVSEIEDHGVWPSPWKAKFFSVQIESTFGPAQKSLRFDYFPAGDSASSLRQLFVEAVKRAVDESVAEDAD